MYGREARGYQYMMGKFKPLILAMREINSPFYIGASTLVLMLLVIPVELQCSFQALDLADYEGCFIDDASRKYPYVYGHTNFVNMTIDYCILGCADDGFKFAALQSRQWCHCGDDPHLTIGTHPKVPDSDCSTPCYGNWSQMCGGEWRLAVYKIHEIKSGIAKKEYKSAFVGKSITTFPLNTGAVTGTGNDAVVNCAGFCNETPQCKAFSLTFSSSMCYVFKGAKLCDPLNADADSTVFYLL